MDNPTLPNPGAELISRVAGGPDLDEFHRSGRESVAELQRTLAIAGRTLDSFASILDFGCGCGRMLLWMEELGRSSALHGTDIDPDAIAWCRANLPYARVTVNDADPPLPYPDGAFELVFNHSVFTHIDARRQDLWLAELHRVIRPGGLLVLSTHGEASLAQAGWEIRDRVEREGIAFLDGTLAPDFPLPDWYQNTFHAPWYVFEHWGRWFEIRAYLPGADLGFQDQILLERGPDGAPPRAPIAARPTGAVEGSADRRVSAALADARAYREDPRASSRFGRAGRLARQLALRAMRPYTAHEDKFDTAVAASIAELTRASDAHAAHLQALDQRLKNGA